MTHVVENTWLTFKDRPTKDTIFTENAVVVYVPTGAGAKGSADIRKLYLGDSYNKRVKETIWKRTVTTESVVEEAEWSITFTEDPCDWLIPKMDTSLFSECTVTFPVVISASFKGDRVNVIRFYWDQSTVLKQLKVINTREHSKWPVLGTEQVLAIRDPTSVTLNSLTKAGSVAAGGSTTVDASSRSRVFSQEQDTPAPVASTKPKPNNHARLFGGDDVEPEPVRQSAPNPRSFKPERRNIFGDAGDEPSTITSSTRSFKPERRAIVGGDDEDEPTTVTSSTRSFKPERRNIFGGGDEDEQPKSTSSNVNRTADRIFGGDEQEEESSKPTKSKGGATVSKSRIFSDESAEEVFRPSSRVTHPRGTGGKSTIFTDESVPEERRTFSYNPQKYASQIVMEENAVPPVEGEDKPARASESQEEYQPDNKRSSRSINPNKHVAQWQLGGEAGETDAPKRSTRSMNHDKNSTQWELMDELAGAEPAAKAKTAVAMNPNKHTSQWSLEGNENKTERPSTKVMQNPGGNTSFKLM